MSAPALHCALNGPHVPGDRLLEPTLDTPLIAGIAANDPISPPISRGTGVSRGGCGSHTVNAPVRSARHGDQTLNHALRIWRAQPGRQVVTRSRRMRQARSRRDVVEVAARNGIDRGGGGACFGTSGRAKFVEPAIDHKARIASVRFSPDGRLLLTASVDGIARLWDWQTRAPVGAEMRHTEGITSAAFRPDGKIVATAGDDATIHFWSVPEGTSAHPLIPNVIGVQAVVFSPDGNRVITSGTDGSTRIWDFATGLAAARPLLRESYVWRTDINRDGILDRNGRFRPRGPFVGCSTTDRG